MRASPGPIGSPCASTTDIFWLQASFHEVARNLWRRHRQLGIPEDRVYSDYGAMAEAESKREDGVDAIAIVTPTDSHYKIAKKVLESGLSVICDKPLCLSVAEAKELKSPRRKGRIAPLPDA